MASAPKPETIHADLGEKFFVPVEPADFPKTDIRFRNRRWAERVGLEGLSEDEWERHFGRFTPLEGTFEKPLALAYHGHQFRTYNPEIGDGRGFLFAQLRDLEDNRLLDLGTKGSGRTPFSRGGDGRLTLKGGVREVLASEMLEALGVYTSKSFSLIETGEQLMRGDEPSPTRSSVLTRLSHSHIRIGTFQRLTFEKDTEALEKLVAHSVAHYLPEAKRETASETAAALLEAVALHVARLGAQWVAAGFVHGVLNSDNITITGESFDYGPWRFLPHYEPGFTAAYFDETGLYAYGRQPEALAWNMTRLAECLMPLSDRETLEPALNAFWPAFQREFRARVLARLGLKSAGEEADTATVTGLFGFLEASQVPFEQVFFDWYGGLKSEERALAGPLEGAYRGGSFVPFRMALEAHEPRDGLRLEHAYFTRPQPRSMVIDEMEAIWAPIAEDDDWTGFETAIAEIREMGEAYGHGPGGADVFTPTPKAD
jgi:uncharacterized protein YdiU (UPF0061 family)